MNHHDSDGEWSPEEASRLVGELDYIAKVFKEVPPVDFNSSWKISVAASLGFTPKSLLECFFDVDGEPLVDRLRGLAEKSVQAGVPILFQQVSVHLSAACRRSACVALPEVHPYRTNPHHARRSGEAVGAVGEQLVEGSPPVPSRATAAELEGTNSPPLETGNVPPLDVASSREPWSKQAKA